MKTLYLDCGANTELQQEQNFNSFQWVDSNFNSYEVTLSVQAQIGKGIFLKQYKQ